ncbi:MAG: hypothetical protein JST54_04775 [Deltaproteobacteria bacterium]|nr:hypothetical protein [Deltaproteobacteria bacterium]
MKLAIALAGTLSAASAWGQGQPACQRDTDCPGTQICQGGVCTANNGQALPSTYVAPPPPTTQPASPAPGPSATPAPAPAPTTSSPPSTLPPPALPPQTRHEMEGDYFGVHAFGDFFPTVDQGSYDPLTRTLVPTQQAIFTGLRLTVPIYRYKQGSVAKFLPGALGTAEFGYTAAGKSAGSGDDGFAVAVGLELRWQVEALDNLIMPFVRFTYVDRITQFSESPNGTLFETAATLSIGAHFVRVFDLHLLWGGTYAGSTAIGLGVGIGYDI